MSTPRSCYDSSGYLDLATLRLSKRRELLPERHTGHGLEKKAPIEVPCPDVAKAAVHN